VLQGELSQAVAQQQELQRRITILTTRLSPKTEKSWKTLKTPLEQH